MPLRKSCETLICQRHQTILRLLSSAATASTRWRVREIYCPTTYRVNESTIRFTKKNKGKMRGSVETTAPPNEKISCVTCCNRFLEKTEKALRVKTGGWRMEMADVMSPYKAVKSTITFSLVKVSVFPSLSTSLP